MSLVISRLAQVVVLDLKLLAVIDSEINALVTPFHVTPACLDVLQVHLLATTNRPVKQKSSYHAVLDIVDVRSREEALLFLLNEIGVKCARLEARVVHDADQELLVGSNAHNHSSGQYSAHATDSFRTRRSMDNDLGDHGVIKDGDLRAVLDTRIEANTRNVFSSVSRAPLVNDTSSRAKVIVGILSAQSHFDSMALVLDVVQHSEFLEISTLGNEELQLDKIQARDGFRNGVLHLETCV